MEVKDGNRDEAYKKKYNYGRANFYVLWEYREILIIQLRFILTSEYPGRDWIIHVMNKSVHTITPVYIRDVELQLVSSGFRFSFS